MSVSIETNEVNHVAPAQQEICLGSKTRMPEFSLAGKVVCVSGGARGLGLTQAEALLEAGAKVYALDRLEEPVSDTLSVAPVSPPLTTPPRPPSSGISKSGQSRS